MLLSEGIKRIHRRDDHEEQYFSVYEENGSLYIETGSEATDIIGDNEAWYEELCDRLINVYSNVLQDFELSSGATPLEPYFDANVKFNQAADQPTAAVYPTLALVERYGLDKKTEQAEIIGSMLNDLVIDVTDAANVFHANAKEALENPTEDPVRKMFALHVSGNAEGPTIIKSERFC